MQRRLEKELGELKKLLHEMSDTVENSISKVIEALFTQNGKLAEEVIQLDDKIDSYEVEIERKCVRIIALYHPEASDLRLVMGAYKVVSDYERIGDEAENIAYRILELLQEGFKIKPLQLRYMAETVKDMVDMATAAFFDGDVELAKKVIEKDNVVDELYHSVERELITYVLEDPQEYLREIFPLLFIARHLERMGDHAENIAEFTFYTSEGEWIRHTPILEREEKNQEQG
ncbi:MAG TPA: phosphate signaling complex protein PhoU [Aquifex aeolicus]|uniref:Phosphate-specific transport system accessory protein PhoU n=1 Tax=Aquifex aeolicus TaxID=63363 RepID=A0A9D0YND2_AQUAO|nr:phosphate signaling complex protein PhoU [Aquificales bacterium]HIP86766.1 phosphate signaling complex protein PhoU [Aquifex sp.]HIP98175.1 phosphate signaling complex protein PhoU [Aquifex aeolicus]HIQ26582.1 phosphate signaling complex protein PhoU [Aquifex aeolicus]